MPRTLEVEFADVGSAQPEGVLILFCEEGVKFGHRPAGCSSPTGDLDRARGGRRRFKGKNGSALDIVRPAGLAVIPPDHYRCRERRATSRSQDFVKLGGTRDGANSGGRLIAATLLADLPGQALSGRSELPIWRWAFNCAPMRSSATRPSARKMKSRAGEIRLTIASRRSCRARKRHSPPAQAVAEGVLLARDLVNEPANVLYPEEFARRIGELEKAWRRRRSARPSADEEARA